jgi:hypothetical protein
MRMVSPVSGTLKLLRVLVAGSGELTSAGRALDDD